MVPFKTVVHWLFNDAWCYLVMGYFDREIGVFQQTVVRGVLYPVTGIFLYPLKILEIQGFFLFSGGIERDQWHGKS